MKRIAIAFLLSFALLYSHSSFAQSADSAEEPKTPLVEVKAAEAQPAVEKTKPKVVETMPVVEKTKPTVEKIQPVVEKTNPTMDGLALLMGVYSPLQDEMKGIYGGAFALSGQYCLNMSKSVDLLASIGFIQKTGNPYYDVPTFSSGSSSEIRIIPMEVSIRRRIVFMKSPSGLVSRGLYVGAGINYVRASEEIPEIMSSSGGDFGMQIFAGPQMFITKNLAFEGEVKLMMNEVDMKHEDERYSITLSGLVIRAALSWYY